MARNVFRINTSSDAVTYTCPAGKCAKLYDGSEIQGNGLIGYDTQYRLFGPGMSTEINNGQFLIIIEEDL